MASMFRIVGLISVLCLLVTGMPVAHADDYSDPEYFQHDLDNYTRARGRQISESISPQYHSHFSGACADTSARAAANQVNDVKFGRVYGGVGQSTCWWSVGDAPKYHSVGQRRVHFISRTGAKLQGHIWGTSAPGPRPGVVITTGSIQASDQMYWWAARALAASGYVVMTFDVQGQGQSETFSHEPGSPLFGAEGVPSQQSANFYDGTIDALRFFLSKPSRPYRPAGWSKSDVASSKAASRGEHVDWVNPGWGVIDRDRLGIAGHSLGASAVSAVQQCSDQRQVWKKLELCGGRSFPIRAVVAWDALSDSGVRPVVPAMSQEADGYFLFPTLSREAPDPNESMGGFNRWRKKGRDVYTYVVRGGTHIEWSQVPYTSATTYGAAMNAFYTIAWMDRYVSDDRKVRAAGYRRLIWGPRGTASNPWSANHFSVRRFSALFLTTPRTHRRVTAVDLRKWAGRSRVGNWAGANDDTQGRYLPD
jgi:hypothetical protein